MCLPTSNQALKPVYDRWFDRLNAERLSFNYGSYNTSLSATAAGTTAVFGQPQQNTGNAYVPREAQFAFHLGF